MNFLAHIYLSGNHPAVMIGNFIGDFVKGRNLVEQFGDDVAKGIMLHREIDAYTDHHPVVQQSKARLRPKYRHYAAVIVDVFYDHYLARNWSAYHPTPLPQYVDATYATLTNNLAILPPNAQYMLPYMMRSNWLVNYGELAGINKALTGMARRTRHESRMDEATADLATHYHDFKAEFEQFFPDLIALANNFLHPLHGPAYPLQNGDAPST